MTRTAVDEHATRAQPFCRMRRWTPMVWAAFVLIGVYWSAATFMLAIDPYDIYPWGRETEAPALDTPDNSMLVIEAAAKRPEIDVVMIGGSTSKTYTPEQIRRIAPDAEHPWNTSYPAIRPADRALTIETFLRHSHAKRYIIWIDWSYVLPAGKMLDRFPSYLYDANHLNDLRMVNQDGVATSWGKLHGSGAFRDGEEVERRVRAADAAKFKSFQTSESMRALEALIRAQRPQVDVPWRTSCDRSSALSKLLVPELLEFSQRHIRADLVFPAFSAAAYYTTVSRGRGPSLPEQLNLRRCIVAAASEIPGVFVWAPDADTNTITDLANYEDSTHLYPPDVLMRVLKTIGDPAFRIDQKNVNAYLEHLHATVVGYNVRNSNLDTGRHDGS